MFSARHYTFIAKIMDSQRSMVSTADEVNTLEDLTNCMAQAFKLDNPRFDEDRFIEACGF